MQMKITHKKRGILQMPEILWDFPRLVWYVIQNNSFQWLNTKNCSSEKNNMFGKDVFLRVFRLCCSF